MNMKGKYYPTYTAAADAAYDSVLVFLLENAIEYQKCTIRLIDFYLPKGLGKISINEESFDFSKPLGIEVKYGLLFDTISRYYGYYKNLKASGKIESLILLCEYLHEEVQEKVAKLQKDGFYVMKIDDFMTLKKDGTNNDDDTKMRTSENLIANQMPLSLKEDWKIEREYILENAHESFAEGNVTLFIGAGVSIDAGLPSWNGLLADLLNKCNGQKTEIGSEDINNIISACGNSSIVTGRFIQLLLDLNRNDNKIESVQEKGMSFVRKIRDVLYPDTIKNSEIVNSICKLVKTKNVKSIITYNFDDIIECALTKERVECYPVFGYNEPQVKLPIYHVHGFIPQETFGDELLLPSAVLSEDKYHELYADAYNWANVEQLHALSRTTCFFIGLSMTDPSLRRLLDIAYKNGEKNSRHYVFLKRYSDFNTVTKDYKNLAIQQTIYRDLGINVIWFDKFEDLPKLLMRLI